MPGLFLIALALEDVALDTPLPSLAVFNGSESEE